MKPKNEHSLGEVIELLKKKYKWGDKMNETAAKKAWYSLLGPVAQAHTTSLTYQKNVLTVGLNSSVLREELWMHQEKLIQALNEELQSENFVVKKIVFL